MWSKKLENGLVVDSRKFLPVEEPEIKQYANNNNVFYLGLDFELKIALKKDYTSNFDTSNSSMSYNVFLHDHILYRYEILKFLGTGSYGVVVKAFDHKLKTEVAIKICRGGEPEKASLKHEAEMLTDLKNKFKAGNFVNIFDYFIFRDTPFLVIELLQDDLSTLLLDSPVQGLSSMKQIIEIMFSTLKGLSQLKEMNIIHGDLKPSNIALWKEEVNEVKIIDFGGSRYANDKTRIKQFTRHYRAPEIILELEHSFSIDMWAFGCISFELYTGNVLFEGVDQNDQLAAIMEVLGSPPTTMRESSPVQYDHFRESGRPIYCTRTNGSIIPSNLRARELPGTKPLRKILGKCPYLHFIDFIQKCLTWNPSNRLTPSEAINHKLFENFAVPKGQAVASSSKSLPSSSKK